MTVKEYLHQANINSGQLAEILGYKSTSPITKRMDEEMPERWTRRLDEMADLGLAPIDAANGATESKESERESNISDDALNDWINAEGRAEDKDPNVNNTNLGAEVIGPQKIKLTTIKGYIEMIYGGAESIARARGDEIAAETINKYTSEYTEAWLDYIKYDERILKYLEQLQIGTPLGNLVGIHAISIGAYVLARITAKEIAAISNANGETEQEL